MLKNKPVMPTIPIVDKNRAKDFYQNILGLDLLEEKEQELIFESGGTKIELYLRSPTKADNTAMTFEVENVEEEVKDLKNNGVKFEEYDMGEIKTIEGIATMGDEKSAWFKDTEGNILCVHSA